MNSEEASKLLIEMGLDPDGVITTAIRLQDMLMLNELVDSARAWCAESIYAGATDDSLTTRLVEAIESYNAAEDRAQVGESDS